MIQPKGSNLSSGISVKRKLLLIEDEEDLAVAIQFYLQRFGYVVHHSTSSLASLEVLKSRRWDGLLIDWMLPDISRTDILEKIRENPPLVTFVMTAREEPRSRGKAVPEGANIYISKPFSLDALRNQLDSIFSKLEQSTPLSV